MSYIHWLPRITRDGEVALLIPEARGALMSGAARSFRIPPGSVAQNAPFMMLCCLIVFSCIIKRRPVQTPPFSLLQAPLPLSLKGPYHDMWAPSVNRCACALPGPGSINTISFRKAMGPLKLARISISQYNLCCTWPRPDDPLTLMYLQNCWCVITKRNAVVGGDFKKTSKMLPVHVI